MLGSIGAGSFRDSAGTSALGTRAEEPSTVVFALCMWQNEGQVGDFMEHTLGDSRSLKEQHRSESLTGRYQSDHPSSGASKLRDSP